MATTLLKQALHLPTSTPTISLTLESGIMPVFHYILKRTCTFLHACRTSSMRDAHLYATTTHTAPFQPLAQFIEISLQLPFHFNTQGLDRLPTTNDILTRAQAFYTSTLHPYLEQDLLANDALNRKISTYTQLIWNQTWGRRHRLYQCTSISRKKYTAFLRLRLLILPLPAYPTAPNPLDFSARHCTLHNFVSSLQQPCCTTGDIQHTLLSCPHMLQHMTSRFSWNHPPSLQHFFRRDDLHELATHTQHVMNFIIASRHS